MASFSWFPTCFCAENRKSPSSDELSITRIESVSNFKETGKIPAVPLFLRQCRHSAHTDMCPSLTQKYASVYFSKSRRQKHSTAIRQKQPPSSMKIRGWAPRWFSICRRPAVFHHEISLPTALCESAAFRLGTPLLFIAFVHYNTLFRLCQYRNCTNTVSWQSDFCCIFTILKTITFDKIRKNKISAAP